MNVYFYLIVFTFLMQQAIGQTLQGKILLQNSPNQLNTIDIKWFSQQLIYPEGIYLYRKSANEAEWQKLNTNPIVRNKKSTLKDEEANALLDIINKASASELQNGMLLLTLLAKTFQSNEFAAAIGIFYQDGAVTDNQSYQYKVTILTNGKEQLLAISAIITNQKYIPIASPKGFKVEAIEKSAKIFWQPDDEQFYAVNIYRKNSSEQDFIKINERPLLLNEGSTSKDSSAVSYLDDSLLQGAIYSYKIAGLDYFGNETQFTEEIQVTIKDLTPPPPIDNLQAKVVNGIVTLTYGIPQSNDISAIGVYRSKKSDGVFELIKVFPSSPAGGGQGIVSDTIPHKGRFYYKVATIDQANNHSYSNPIFVEVADVWAPLSPIGLTIKSDTGKIDLTWTNNTETDLMGYYIFRCITPADTQDYVLLNTEPLKNNYYTDQLPSRAKNNFYYCIVAVDSSYNRSHYSKVVQATLPDIFPPEQPVWKRHQFNQDTVYLEWLSNVDKDLKTYILHRTSENNNKEWHLSSDITSFKDSHLKPNTSYTYSLVAVDSSSNQSKPSNVIKIVTPDKATIASIKINKANYSVKKEHIQLEWQISSNVGLVGYTIYQLSKNDSLATPISELLNKEIFASSSVNNIEDSFYEVRAYFNNGDMIRSKAVKLKTVK